MKGLCLLLFAIVAASLVPRPAHAEVPSMEGCVTAYTRSIRGVTDVRMSPRNEDKAGITYVPNGTLVVYCPSRFTRYVEKTGSRFYLLVWIFSKDGDPRGQGWVSNAVTRAFFMILEPVEWE